MLMEWKSHFAFLSRFDLYILFCCIFPLKFRPWMPMKNFQFQLPTLKKKSPKYRWVWRRHVTPRGSMHELAQIDEKLRRKNATLHRQQLIAGECILIVISFIAELRFIIAIKVWWTRVIFPEMHYYFLRSFWIDIKSFMIWNRWRH